MDKALCKKMLLAMRITALIICTALMQVHATGYGQGITLSAKNISIVEVFSSIEKQSGYLFLYEDGVLENTRPVTLDIKNASLEEALNACFRGQPLSWHIIKDNILVRRKEIVSDTLADLHGTVVNEKGEPVPRATVTIKGTDLAIFTSEKGEFTLKAVPENITLVITSVGYVPQELPVHGRMFVTVRMKEIAVKLGGVEVLYSSGYQSIPKERATGSFDLLDTKLIERSVSTDILSRMDGVASGVLFNTNTFNGKTVPLVSIRGRSTIFSNADPLIIVDNFPYEGDINNINPNDVLSISILKDAAAASIWGTRAGNGVIVITTKKGYYNSKPRISFNGNLTVSQQPDLFAVPQLSSSDFIGVEEYLFNNGYFSGALSNPYSAISPVVDILNQRQMGLISPSDSSAQINALKNIDARHQLGQYFYQPAIIQQYALNLEGGGEYNKYYLSLGYDDHGSTQVANDYKRYTLTANNTFNFFSNRLQIFTGIIFANAKSYQSAGNYTQARYPYQTFVDANGNEVPEYSNYKKSFLDTVGQGKLLDWTFKPVNERYGGPLTELTDYKLNFGLDFRVFSFLKLNLNYQYEKGVQESNTDHSLNSYYTRNLVNDYTQIDYGSGNIVYPIPVGDIIYYDNRNYSSNTVRGQLDYSQNFGKAGNLVALAGAEVRDYSSFDRSYNLYGYDPSTATNVQVDYLSYFNLQDGNSARIPDGTGQSGTTDRLISYFANAAYTYRNKYTISVSGRKDKSNLFGVDANQKGVPLYSAGFKWDIDRESFYHFTWLPILKLRITDGYNGNLNKSISAYTTAANPGYTNMFDQPMLNITNPPNPSLRWEKDHMLNFGLDFGSPHNNVTGTVEYFVKYGTDLIGLSATAPQTGVTQFTGNNSSIRTNGVDLTVNTINLKGKIGWRTNFLFSYVIDKITKYDASDGANYFYTQAAYTNPIKGRPYLSIYTYRWAGLDPQGNPQGYLDGKISEDYASIINSTDNSQLVYNGPATPTIFGSLRNTFTWNHLEFSFNIKYKMGYYIKRGSVNYSYLYSGEYQLADFDKRWQQPGDEKITNVPSMIYPLDGARDLFYNNSQILVEKGDNIRLQDIQLNYTLNTAKYLKAVQNLNIYAYINNVGILWRANKEGLDPDVVNNGNYGIPLPRTFSFGIKAIF